MNDLHSLCIYLFICLDKELFESCLLALYIRYRLSLKIHSKMPKVKTVQVSHRFKTGRKIKSENGFLQASAHSKSLLFTLMHVMYVYGNGTESRFETLNLHLTEPTHFIPLAQAIRMFVSQTVFRTKGFLICKSAI